MRNRHLHRTLHALAEEAGLQLAADLSQGAEVPFELTESQGSRVALYSYVPKTDAFIRSIRDFLHDQDIPLIRFQKGQRKDDVFKKHLRKFKAQEGVVFVGVAQEKVRVPRTSARASARVVLSLGSIIPALIPS